MPSSARKPRRSVDDRLDRVFHALADRTRRAVLRRLSQQPASVNEIAEPFAMSRPAISKHLRVLEEAKLIRRDVEGRVHLCSLQPEALRNSAAWLDYYRTFWDEKLAALAHYAETVSPAKGGRT